MDQTQCLVINMDGHEDRFEKVKAELAKANVPNVTRLPAVVGKNIPFSKRLDHFENPLLGAVFPKSGLGCSLSHRKAWKLAAESKSPYTVVLEDDVRWFSDVDVRTVWQRVSNAVQNKKDFDVFLLGYYGDADPLLEGPKDPLVPLIGMVAKTADTSGDDGGEVFRPARLCGSHAYIVSRSGARKLLQIQPKVAFHQDVELGNLSADNKINMVAIRPQVLKQDHSGSSQATASPYAMTPLLEAVYPSAEHIQPVDFSARFPIMEVGTYKVSLWHFLVGGLSYAGGILNSNTTAAFVVGSLVLGCLLALDSLLVGGVRPQGWTLLLDALIFGGLFAAFGSMTRCALDWCVDCTKCWNRR